MRRRWARWAPPALVSVLLAACAPAPLVDDGLGFGERRARLESFSNWQMRGRLTVDTGEEAFQGRFTWRQSGDRLVLTIRVGPFGAGGVRIDGTPQTLEVTSRGETRRLENPETDLSRLLGWWLPVTSLEHWLLGIPDQAYAAQTRPGRYGTLDRLEQRRWRVAYGDYTQRAGLLMPQQVEMAHGPLRIGLTIDAFEPAPVSAARGTTRRTT